MRAQKDNLAPEDQASNIHPIEFLTENGFAILRPWEFNRAPLPKTGRYNFIVRNPQNSEREIVVELAAPVIAQIEVHRRGRNFDSFWICIAERHLANYLSEINDYPVSNKLVVTRLDPADINLALRWGRT